MKLIDRLKEIRRVFQKGKPFTDNQTKGKRKQFTPINIRLSTIRFILDYKSKDRAIEEAKKDLEFFKRNYSERSYYRLKKRLKEDLALEI